MFRLILGDPANILPDRIDVYPLSIHVHPGLRKQEPCGLINFYGK